MKSIIASKARAYLAACKVTGNIDTTPAKLAKYVATIAPLVDKLIDAQGDTMADMRALAALFKAHQDASS